MSFIFYLCLPSISAASERDKIKSTKSKIIFHIYYDYFVFVFIYFLYVGFYLHLRVNKKKKQLCKSAIDGWMSELNQNITATSIRLYIYILFKLK